MAILTYTFETIFSILKPAQCQIVDDQCRIDTLAYDSRKLPKAGTSLFFALQSLQDGHHYAKSAYDQGVRNFVLQSRNTQLLTALPEANIAFVPDTLKALQSIAAFHRSQFTYPVIGITGSNGKTIVKDWLYQLLLPDYTIVRSPKSYNSQLGVALSLWQMNEDHQLAIIEAGISKPGEMERLENMIRPSIAVITSIGEAHQEGFESFEQKYAEKAILLQHARQTLTPEKLPSYEVDIKENTSILHIENGHCPLQIPFVDRASVENAYTCWRIMRLLGYDHEIIAERIRHLQQMEMRLQLKDGINRCTLIDDSYSNDLSSLAISLDFLLRQKQHPTRTLIWSDLPEVGGNEQEAYEKVVDLLTQFPVDQLITVGPRLADKPWHFPIPKWLAFYSTEDLLNEISGLGLSDQSILIKGARKFGFERVTAKLSAQSHETRLELHMDNLGYNLKQYKSLIGPHVKVMAMVKAFSYGSGSFEIASFLQFHKVDYLTVAYADEGVALRKAGIRLPIMVMNPDVNSFSAILEAELAPELFSFDILKQWNDFIIAQQIHKPSTIHIKIDTGMHRLGFQPEEMQDLGQFLKDKQHLKVESVFSHLVASGNPELDDITRGQLASFQAACNALEDGLGYSFIKHIANTDAIHRFPEAHLDMVRLGIGLYGVNSPENLDLLQVPILKTTITQIHELAAGTGVGYGLKGKVKRQSKIATVRIGYADGYDRRFGNGVGQMQIHGKFVPTIGDICMDLCMVDVTEVPEVAVGDEVIVYGDIAGLAKKIGTIPYELLVRISQRVKRVYYYGW